MPFEEFLEEKNLNRPVSATVETTIGQLFYLILAYCAANSLSCVARINLFKLINNILGSQILPGSKFLLDKLLNPDRDSQFHAVCNFCGVLVGQFGPSLQLIKNCSVCKHKLDLTSSASQNFFVLTDPSQQISDLISMYQEHYLKIMKGETGSTPNFISDVYDGQMYKDFVAKLPPENKHNYLTAMLNTDGAQKFESSKFSIWPIFLLLNELPAQVRLTKIVTCGLWYSKIQPNMDIFLGQFAKYFQNIQNKGIPCFLNGQIRSIPLYITQCCVDSSARTKIQGIQQYSGYHSCNWCLQEGDWDNYVRFSYEKKIELRNHETTREKMKFFLKKATKSEKAEITKTTGINGICSLIKIKEFNIIFGFVVDYMHCILEGVAKQLTELHLRNLSAQQIEELDEIMMAIPAPHQVARLTRGLSKRGQWKAREWENYVLFYSYAVLSTFLPNEKLKHWLLFSNSLHILLQKKISFSELETARKNLDEFVKKFEEIYFLENMTFNVHLLLHIADSVLHWGPLWTQNTFCFESENHNILKAIKSANGVTHQIVRFLNYNYRTSILGLHVLPDMTQLLRKFCEQLFSGKRVKNVKKIGDHTYFETSSVCHIDIETEYVSGKHSLYTKMIKDGCLYSNSTRATRSNNSYACLDDGTFIRISAFIIKESTNEERIICEFLKVRDLPGNVNCPVKKITEIPARKRIVFTNQLKTICVFAKNRDFGYICPLPNLFHY